MLYSLKGVASSGSLACLLVWNYWAVLFRLAENDDGEVGPWLCELELLMRVMRVFTSLLCQSEL